MHAVGVGLELAGEVDEDVLARDDFAEVVGDLAGAPNGRADEDDGGIGEGVEAHARGVEVRGVVDVVPQDRLSARLLEQ